LLLQKLGFDQQKHADAGESFVAGMPVGERTGGCKYPTCDGGLAALF